MQSLPVKKTPFNHKSAQVYELTRAKTCPKKEKKGKRRDFLLSAFSKNQFFGDGKKPKHKYAHAIGDLGDFYFTFNCCKQPNKE